MRPERERPGGSTGAAQMIGAGERITVDSTAADDIAALARRRSVGIRVVTQHADGRVVAQIYMSLYAAERKVRNCRARGLPATLHLVRLVPFNVLDGGDAL